MKKWLFHPFTYFAGTKALISGLLIVLLTALLASLNNVHFDGVLDMHIGLTAPAWIYLAEAIINWLILTFVFLATGKLLGSRGARIIDVAGTVALSRWPMLFVTLSGFLPFMHVQKPADISAAMLFISAIMLLFVIWMITLLYQSFRVCFNLKDAKLTGGFIAAIIVAELISKVLFHYLYQSI